MANSQWTRTEHEIWITEETDQLGDHTQDGPGDHGAVGGPRGRMGTGDVVRGVLGFLCEDWCLRLHNRRLYLHVSAFSLTMTHHHSTVSQYYREWFGEIVLLYARWLYL